jgi:hypothetical protein
MSISYHSRTELQDTLLGRNTQTSVVDGQRIPHRQGHLLHPGAEARLNKKNLQKNILFQNYNKIHQKIT